MYSAPWPTHHRDFRNSDFTPFLTSTDYELAWTALDGFPVITAPTIGFDGNIYVATGKKGTGNLHAYTRYGRLLWTHPEVNFKALSSSPVIDDRGVIYITDQSRLWAVNPDGSTRWSHPVPGPFATAILIGDNSVGGITLNGHVLLFDRNTGLPNANPLVLEGTPPVPPPGLLKAWEGLVDPETTDSIVGSLLGYGTLVANTPAVHPNGRLVIIVTGDGFIHGIHIEPGDIHLVYKINTGEQSGTSPVISPDGQHVYFCDGDGELYCYNPYTGQRRWRITLGKSFASPSIDERGVVYVAGGPAVYAVRDGVVLWKNDLQKLARKLVPASFVKGQRINSRAQPVTAVSVTPRHLLLQVDFGHPLPLPSGGAITSPRWTGIVILDRQSGKLVGEPVRLRDTGGAVVTINADGRIYCAHGGVTTTLAYQLMNPYLPRFRHFPAPTGGISALRPRQPLAHMKEQLNQTAGWLLDLDRAALLNERETVQQLKELSLTQLQNITLNLADGVSKKELSAAIALSINKTVTATLEALSRFDALDDLDGLRNTAQRERFVLLAMLHHLR
jgi:outer membrane protein assembly factor BamB